MPFIALRHHRPQIRRREREKTVGKTSRLWRGQGSSPKTDGVLIPPILLGRGEWEWSRLCSNSVYVAHYLKPLYFGALLCVNGPWFDTLTRRTPSPPPNPHARRLLQAKQPSLLGFLRSFWFGQAMQQCPTDALIPPPTPHSHDDNNDAPPPPPAAACAAAVDFSFTRRKKRGSTRPAACFAKGPPSLCKARASAALTLLDASTSAWTSSTTPCTLPRTCELTR